MSLTLEKLVLENNTVDIWPIPLSTLATIDCPLTIKEQAHEKKFKFARLQQHYAAPQSLLRHLLSVYLNCKPSDLSFIKNAYGKPTLADLSPSLYFNYSYCHDYILYAFARSPDVGIDIERIDITFEIKDLITQQFCIDELNEWHTFNKLEKITAFYRGWSRKEAFIKAIGLGLHFPLTNLHVSLADDYLSNLLIDITDSNYCPSEWQIKAIPIDNTHTAAIALPRSITKINKRLFQPL